MHNRFPILSLLAMLAGAAFAPVPVASGLGVVLNEIMYHPPDDLDGLQFVELFNAGGSEADISGWSFSKGITFVFAPGTKLSPGAFTVVCRNRADFVERYGAGVPLAGEFSGKLSHGGERLELVDQRKQVVEAVAYSDHAPWPIAPDGASASLERICPQARPEASNWEPSRLPTLKRPTGSPGRTNHCFSTNPLPVIGEVQLRPERPLPEQPVAVRAHVADADGIRKVTLFYRVAAGSQLSQERAVSMQQVAGASNGYFEGVIPAQPAGRLVRYRLQAMDGAGGERNVPSTNELRPMLTYSTFVNTNEARVPFGFLLHPRGEGQPVSDRRVGRLGGLNLTSPRGEDAFVYLPPRGGPVQVFDFVRMSRRNGGFKVRFLSDQTLSGMTVANLIFEGPPRQVLSEPLAYELYRLAGVPAERTEHVRVWEEGRLSGYHLLIEQPNKSFLRRHGRDDTGNLYKLIWYGRTFVDKHEKKTHRTMGHEDLEEVVRGLEQSNGAGQWEFIERHFNVTNFINYFAVNMCIQNWDGFFNNYFTYHDTGGTGRWEIYPWDEDKTWGDYDGVSSRYDWYTMPLTFGMNVTGAATGRFRLSPFGGDNFHSWSRPPGFFSGPMLANPEFRRRFLSRLREICETVFTEAKFLPVIDALEQRLAPEISVRARALGEDAAPAERRFRADMESVRRQLTNRRKFILAELANAGG
jgi:hypothetical protein